MPYFNDNTLSIGKSPLVKLNHVANGARATVLGKIEGRNPAYSVKCRIGAAMIWDAERRGSLKPGVELVEPTSGNTGIALAFVAAARGYRLTLAMPETFSLERRKVLKDPESFRLHRGLYPGGSFEIGAERFLKSITTTSIELTWVNHLVLAQRDPQFPSGYNSNLMAMEWRLGVNYYFDPLRQKNQGLEIPGAK